MTRRTALRSLVTCAATVPAVAVASNAAARSLSPASVGPELEFVQDGPDLLVRTVVRANNSPHALWTTVIGGESDRPTLRYYVIQNQDTFVRSMKRVAVEWRLPGRTKDGLQVQVDERFSPNTAELTALLPQIQQLIDAGERIKNARNPE